MMKIMKYINERKRKMNGKNARVYKRASVNRHRPFKPQVLQKLQASYIIYTYVYKINTWAGYNRNIFTLV